MAAKHNEAHGPSVMKLLLDPRGEMNIIEDVLMVVVHNETTGSKLLKVLLCTERDVDVTEEILEAPMRLLNFDESLLFLLERVKAIRVTQKFLKAAVCNARCGGEKLKRLIEFQKDFSVPEEMMMALTGGNKVTGAEVMQLLEDPFGKVQITNKVMRTAARRGSHWDDELLVGSS